MSETRQKKNKQPAAEVKTVDTSNLRPTVAPALRERNIDTEISDTESVASNASLSVERKMASSSSSNQPAIQPVNQPRPKSVYIDDEFEKKVLKLLTGSTLVNIIDELKVARLSEEQKKAVVRVSIACAVSARQALPTTTGESMTIIMSLPIFMLNNKVNFTKLAMIGHVLLSTDAAGIIGLAWRTRIGGYNIFSVPVPANFTPARRQALENIKAKAAYDSNVAATIISYFGF